MTDQNWTMIDEIVIKIEDLRSDYYMKTSRWPKIVVYITRDGFKRINKDLKKLAPPVIVKPGVKISGCPIYLVADVDIHPPLQVAIIGED